MNTSLDMPLATKLCQLVVAAAPDNDRLQPVIVVAILRALAEAMKTTRCKSTLTDKEYAALAALQTMYKEGGVPDPETLRSVLAILRQTANEPAGDTVEPLTTREREILTHIANGFSNKEIANMLNIGVRTVETHRERIMRKLDIHNVAGLTRYALRKGLITLD